MLHTREKSSFQDKSVASSSPPLSTKKKSAKISSGKNALTSRIVGMKIYNPNNYRALSADAELKGMEEAEIQQKKIDRFWGKDKEAYDCSRERMEMERENKRSEACEAHNKFLLHHAQWEADYQQKQLAMAYDEALVELEARKGYLSQIFSSKSSQEIMSYQWPLSKSVSAQHLSSQYSSSNAKYFGATGSRHLFNNRYGKQGAGKEQGLSIITTLSNPQQQTEEEEDDQMSILRQQQYFAALTTKMYGNNNGNSNGNGNESFSSGFNPYPIDFSSSIVTGNASMLDRMSLTLPESDMQVRISVHFDNGNKKSADVVESAMMQQQNTNNSSSNLAIRQSKSMSRDENINTSKSATMTLSSSNIKNKDELKMKALSAKAKAAAASKASLHVEALDGHPKYRWDQEVTLRAAFRALDTSGNRQYLSYSDFVDNIASNQIVNDLLLFTVFGSWLKRKQWNVFHDLFVNSENNSNNKDETTPLHPSSLNITLDDWIYAARNIAFENRKQRRHIRTETEHTQISNVSDNLQAEGWYASQSRRQSISSEKAATMSRVVSVGDVVFSLYGGGIMWLPAVVTKINEHDDISGISYDLSYFMTQQDLQQCRHDATARPLNILPSELPTQIFIPKPLALEKTVCENVYDMVDVERSNKLNANTLLEALRSKMMVRVISSSVALSMIVQGASSTDSAARSHILPLPIAEAFLSLFPSTISRSEFTEFALYAVDLHNFNRSRRK